MWFVDAVLIWLANMWFPVNFVLGSMKVSAWMGIIMSSFLWTLLIWFTQPLANKFKIKLSGSLHMAIAYFVANFVVLWLVARLGPVIGFGVSGWTYVLGLAFVANLVQYGTWVLLAKFKLAKM